jgi:hypothetical protein
MHSILQGLKFHNQVHTEKKITLQVRFPLLRHTSTHVFHIPSLLSNGFNNNFRNIQWRYTANRNCTKTCNVRPPKSASFIKAEEERATVTRLSNASRQTLRGYLSVSVAVRKLTSFSTHKEPNPTCCTILLSICRWILQHALARALFNCPN